MPETIPADIMAALNAFDQAAQRHGWEADQGSASDADVAERVYAQRRAELIAAISESLSPLAELKSALERIEAGR